MRLRPATTADVNILRQEAKNGLRTRSVAGTILIKARGRLATYAQPESSLAFPRRVAFSRSAGNAGAGYSGRG